VPQHAPGGARRIRSLILVLAACSGAGAVSTNLFLPALPQIREHFAVSVAASQATISAYLIAFACGILIAGPLSDHLGRKPTMVGGLCLFTLGSLLAALAPALSWLVAARIVQALGASAGLIVARATVGDLFQGAQLARMIATLTMTTVLGTTLSPYLGGLIAAHFGWQKGFWLLVALGAVLALAARRLLPAGGAHAARASSIGALWRQSRSVLARPVFFGYVLQAGAIYSVFIVFIAYAPYLMHSVFHRPPTEFGLYYFMFAGGYFLGNLYVSKAADRTSAYQLMRLGLSLQFAFALLALVFALAGLSDPLWIFGPMLPLSIGQGLALPNITAKAVTLAPGFAGIASSLIGFSQQAVGGIAVQAMGFAPIDTVLPVLIFCTAIAALGLLSILAHGEPPVGELSGPYA
jgi:MFS transporter, DHA1 family, multidrug resistance protein